MHKKIILLVKKGFKPYYCDTDSILFSGPKDSRVPLTFSLAFGDFKHELGEKTKISRFEAFGRKNFSISYENQTGPQTLVKVCGMTLESKIVQDELAHAAEIRESAPKLTQIRKIFRKEIGLRCPSLQRTTLNKGMKLSCERKLDTDTEDRSTKPWGY